MNQALYDSVDHLYDEEVSMFTEAMDDVPFYLEYALKAGGEVLEMACGTGRILIPLAEEGIAITGLDVSGNMLDQARRKIRVLPERTKNNITLVQQDMTGFRVGRRFNLIVCPFRSFQHLLSKKEQGRCLERVHEHLSDNGLFILDLFAPFHNLLAEQSRTIHLGSFRSATLDALVTRHSAVTYDLAQQTLHEDRFYEWTDKKGILHRHTWSFDLAYLFRQEAELLLEKHGFEVIAVYGDFKKSPYDYYSGEQIFVAKKGR